MSKDKDIKSAIINELDSRIALLGKNLEQRKQEENRSPLSEIIGGPLKRELEEIRDFVERL